MQGPCIPIERASHIDFFVEGSDRSGVSCLAELLNCYRAASPGASIYHSVCSLTCRMSKRSSMMLCHAMPRYAVLRHELPNCYRAAMPGSRIYHSICALACKVSKRSGLNLCYTTLCHAMLCCDTNCSTATRLPCQVAACTTLNVPLPTGCQSCRL